VGGQTYWMFHNEIQPYFGEKNVWKNIKQRGLRPL
jgi:hypothetical protein